MTSYLFIDGGYLRACYEHHMKEFYGVVPDMDFPQISGHLNLGAERVYYYDAIDDSQHASETEAAFKERLAVALAGHERISRWTGFHVRTGHVRKSSKKKNRTQKGVDVMLAVDALEHAARGNIKKAVLLAGDLDFEPLLNSLVRLGVWTTLVYVPNRTSKELMRAADEIKKLTIEHFHVFSPMSFRQSHERVRIQYNESPPDPVIFKALRKGTYKGRAVALYNAANSASPRLYVWPDDEGTKSSYLLSYSDTNKLPQAFELTFGPITWEPQL